MGAMSDVSLIGIKFAQVMGKPLSKSLYRQLPQWAENKLLATLEDERFQWAATIHGKVNWCPSDCDAVHHPACDENCHCRLKRSHQHLLIGSKGSILQGYVYAYVDLDGSWPMSDRYWKKYELLSNESVDLQKAVQASPCSDWNLEMQLSLDERRRVRLEYQGKKDRLKVLGKEMRSVEAAAAREFDMWVQAELSALPVILLR